MLGEEQLKRKDLEGVLGEEQLKLKGYEKEMGAYHASLSEILNSPGWKFILSFRNKMNRISPQGSISRKVIDKIVNSITKQNDNKTRKLHETKVERLNENYQKWLEKTTNLLKSEPRMKILKHKKISIIIPVYNQHEVVIPCIESVLKNSTRPYEIIIIDDNSNESEIESYWKKINQKSNVNIIKNKTNLGFVKSVNKGMANSKSDVILLNSDTIVTGNWLDKIYSCAYSNSKIATVSPLSNNATICSFPDFVKPNQIPEGFTLEKFSRLIEKLSESKYYPSPTSPGFCIFIKRSVIDELGLFDEKFHPAYGEEDDFCMRAYKKGYLSVIDDGTYIFHHGEKSFSEKSKILKENHMKLLLEKYPDYLDIVGGYCQENPYQEFQLRIKNAVLRKNKKDKKILVVVHQSFNSISPGGTELFVKTTFENLVGYEKYLMYVEKNKIIVEEFSEKPRILFEFTKKSFDSITSVKSEKEFFSDILDELNISIVHFHHLMNMPLDFIGIAKEKGLYTVINCNDFYFICPTANLLYNSDFNEFCNACTDLEKCNKCLTGLGFENNLQEIWRKECKKQFNNSDIIISPTKIVSQIYKEMYNIKDEKMKIFPHGFTPISNTQISTPEISNTIKIGFVGEVMISHKGFNLIIDLLNKNPFKNIEWHFFGKNSDPLPFLKGKKEEYPKNIVNHGTYNNKNLPNLLNHEKVNIVIIPSLETFSNVLSEVWFSRIPVIVPNVLALGERVLETGGGWLYEYPGTTEEIFSIIKKIIDKPNEYYAKVKNVEKIKIISDKECVRPYKDVYDNLINEFGKENE